MLRTPGSSWRRGESVTIARQLAVTLAAWRTFGGTIAALPDVSARGMTIDHQDELALDDVPHLFLRVRVLVEVRGVGSDVPVSKGHVLGVEEPPRPTRQR